MDEERLIVALEARIRDFEKNMVKAERRGTQSYTRLRTDSRSATAAMEADMIRSTSRINQALASTSSRVGAFGKAFAATAVVAGFAALTRGATQAVRSLAEIQQQADRAGVSVQAFQELKFVAEQNRIDVDAMVDGLKELQIRADEFVETGKGSGEEAFRRLGYSAQDLKRRLEEPEKLFLDIVDRLEDMDRAAQIRIADEVFGGTGGERFVELLGQGDDGIRKLMDRAHELGVVIEDDTVAKAAELDKKFAEISQRVSTLAKTIVVELAGSIDEALTIDVDDIFGSAERAIAMMGEQNYRAMKEGTEATEEQVRSVEGLHDTYEGLFRAIDAATGPDGIRLMDVADIDQAHELAAILQDIDREMQAFKNGSIAAQDFEGSVHELVAEAQDLIAELDAVDAQRFGNVVDAIGGISGALMAAARNAAALRANLPSGNDEGLTYGPQNGRRPEVDLKPGEFAPETSLRPQLPSVNHSFGVPDPVKPTGGGGRGGGGGSAKAAVDEYRREVERTREEIARLEAEAVALAAVAETGFEYGDAVDYARKRAELLYEAQAAGKTLTPEMRNEIDQLAAAYTRAGQAADDAATRMAKIQENAERGADAMSDLFLGILDGSTTAEDALKRLVIQLIEVQFRKAMLGLANSSAGSGFFSSVGRLLGFSGGGYTGSGGVNEPAGIVHAGEFVVKAAETRKPKIRSLLEAINSGLPGFAQGGYVPGQFAQSPAHAPASPVMMSGQNGKVALSITVDGQGNIVPVVRQVSGQVAVQTTTAGLAGARKNMAGQMQSIRARGTS